MPVVANLFLSLLTVPAAASSLYLLILTLLSATPRTVGPSTRKMRFDVIVPAHNEESSIANVVRSIQAVDWPADCFRVVVVADNCSDATAEVARQAGASVLIRQDEARRGKGYALAHAFAESRQRDWAEAVAIVDADSQVSRNLLEAMAARLESGEQVIQVHYGVSNIDASWRTRLMAIAMGAFHRVRSRARERMGLSCGIRGNGWGLTLALLERVPYDSFSLVEDLEFGIALGMRGVRVAYADEAWCDGQMVTGGSNARSQRRRWEQGRMAVLRAQTLPLLRRALSARSRVCLDLALDLLVLPLSYIALNAVILTAAGWFLAPSEPGVGFFFATGVACCAALTLYLLRGWQLSNTGLRGLIDLLRAPFFMLWKLAVLFRGRRTTEWVRTNREEN